MGVTLAPEETKTSPLAIEELQKLGVPLNAISASTPGREDGFFFPNTFQFNGGRTFTAGARVRF